MREPCRPCHSQGGKPDKRRRKKRMVAGRIRIAMASRGVFDPAAPENPDKMTHGLLEDAARWGAAALLRRRSRLGRKQREHLYRSPAPEGLRASSPGLHAFIHCSGLIQMVSVIVRGRGRGCCCPFLGLGCTGNAEAGPWPHATKLQRQARLHATRSAGGGGRDGICGRAHRVDAEIPMAPSRTLSWSFTALGCRRAAGLC